MNQSEQKIVQYLGEAHASEVGLTRVIEAQIAMTPRGSFRDLLEGHLTETRDHAERVRGRIVEIAGKTGFNPLSLGIAVAGTVIGQVIAIGKAPIDMIRGSGGEEKLLKNAKDDCAAESLEIATYLALEALARSAGDAKTAALARSILADEVKMLESLRAELPRLVEAVAAAAFGGDPTYDVTTTGSADAVRKATRSAGKTVDEGVQKTRQTLSGSEPWPGYDDQTAGEIVKVLNGSADAEMTTAVRKYEHAHKDRATVIRATERELAGAAR